MILKLHPLHLTSFNVTSCHRAPRQPGVAHVRPSSSFGFAKPSSAS